MNSPPTIPRQATDGERLTPSYHDFWARPALMGPSLSLYKQGQSKERKLKLGTELVS